MFFHRPQRAELLEHHLVWPLTQEDKNHRRSGCRILLRTLQAHLPALLCLGWASPSRRTDTHQAEAEQQQLEILKKHEVECIVLARYMQIISPQLIEHYPNKIINIHHSFLPAFPGAKPYHSAYNRGVKIIGATSHYVTEELDAGPIIAQDITQVSHLHSVGDFIAKGRDLERIVLSKAIQLHTNRKVMVYQNKTVIFS